MMDETKLYDLYVNNKKMSFNVIFNDFKSVQTLNYKQNHFYVYEVAEILNTASAMNSVVGCIVNLGIHLPAIILGILKASSAFIFLDVHKPCISLKNVQNYVPITTLLIEESFLKDLSKILCECWVEKHKVTWDNFSSLILLQSSDCSNSSCLNSKQLYLNSHTHISKLAYIIQTSGTTGEPKIVQVPHQCIVPNVIDLKQRFDVNSEDVIILCSPITFDPSIIDVFLAVSSGCTLVIVPDLIKRIPKQFIEVIVNNKATILQATPSLIQNLGNDFVKDVLLSKDSILRVLAFGGEPCPSLEILKRWKSKENNTKLFNLYGLTEVSCWASCFEINLGDNTLTSNIPLGKPLLDTDIEMTKEGELYIGGEKRWCIVNDEQWPHDRHKIMRSTGDIAIQMPNDMLYFEGRKDSIIKFKGQKLSLLRINALLEDVDEISNHFLHFDKVSSKLLLFIIQDSKTTFNEKLRYNVLKKLQNSISNLPVIEIITTAYIPLTKHGKTDVKKLLSLRNTEDQLGKNCVPMSVSESLEVVCKLWKDYTKQCTISETDSFILNGGDSILALQLISDIEWELQMQIPELLDIVLNCSFKDVCEIIKNNLREARKLKWKDQNISVSIKEFSPGPSPKKVCVAFSECFEMASRRGYFLRCNHSKERTCNYKICDKLFNTNLSLEITCKFDLKKCIDASPCVAYFFRSNKLLVFIGSHAGLFCCFSLLEADVKWTINLPDRIESSSCISFCGKYVYVGCYDHNLYGINIKDGSILWHFKTGAEVKSSPVVSSQNVVFVGSHDKHLYAINGENGKLLWKKIIAHGSIFSSPMLFEKLHAVSVATLDGTVAVLKMDSGDFIWTFHYKKPIFSSPLFTSSGIFIGATNNCFLHFNVSGSLILEYETKGSIFSSACVILNNDHIVFGCHDSSVYCIKSNGENVWKFCGDSPVYSTPFAFQWNQSKYIAVASVSGVLYILDQTHGEVKHSWKCPGEIFSSPTVLNNFLVIGCRDNNVYCFSLSNVC